MRVIPISDIPKMDDNDIVDCVVGQITKLYERTAGESDKGAWSFQNLTLKDQTGEIQVKLKDRDALDPKQWKGKRVCISCNVGDKGKTGVKAKDDTYREKTSRILWVTSSAHIEPHDGQAATADPKPQAAPPTQAPPPQQTAAAAAEKVVQQVTQPPPQNGHSDGPDVRKKLNRLANLYIECLSAGVYIDEQFNEANGGPMNDAQFQACVSSLFICVTRENLQDYVRGGTWNK